LYLKQQAELGTGTRPEGVSRYVLSKAFLFF
jgi:hypothetical protein